MSAQLALPQGSRHMRVGSWSNDQRKLAVLLGEYMDSTPPFARVAEDLIVIGEYDSSALYDATARPHGWPTRY